MNKSKSMLHKVNRNVKQGNFDKILSLECSSTVTVYLAYNLRLNEFKF